MPRTRLRTVDIEPADRDDFHAVVVPYLRELRPGWEPTPEWEASYFDELRGESTRFLWWAVVGDERVGFANFAVVQDLRDPSRMVGELNELTIFPEHRRKGHGSTLARAAVRQLRNSGAGTIEATIRADDEAALAFWRSLNFEPVSTVVALPPDAEPGGGPAARG